MRTSDRHDLLHRRFFGICRQAKWGMTSEAKSTRGLYIVPIAIDQQVDAGAAVLSDQVGNHFQTYPVKMQEPQEDRHFRMFMPIFTAM